MEATARQQIDSLIRQAARDPGHHSLFPLLRALEQIVDEEFQWGQTASPSDEPIRVGQNLSLAFEGREVAAIRAGRHDRPTRVMQNVVTLTGPSGPMPLHFAEAVREREFNQGDPVLARFLDTLLHRVITLFYRAWSLNRVHVSADKPPHADGVLKALLSIGGLGEGALDGSMAIDPRSLAVQVVNLARPTCGVRQLAPQLEHYFQVPVKIESFVPSFTPISPAGRWRLRPPRTDSTMRLGAGLPIGNTTCSVSDRIRIVLGPMEAEDYERFLPGTRSRRRLEEWVRLFVGVAVDWDLRLIMKKPDAQPLRLGQQGRLNRDGWLGRRRPHAGADGYHRRFEPLNEPMQPIGSRR